MLWIKKNLTHFILKYLYQEIDMSCICVLGYLFCHFLQFSIELWFLQCGFLVITSTLPKVYSRKKSCTLNQISIFKLIMDMFLATLYQNYVKKMNNKKPHCRNQNSIENCKKWQNTCHKWPQICSTCRKYCLVLSSFTTYYWVCN
jgi:hypothetical protein